jgi:hypothetical protein
MSIILKYKYVFFIVFAFILYGNTIQNNYALDDDLVTRNNITTKGFSSIKTIFTTPYSSDEEGNGFEYRPIVKLSFAIEHGIFPVNPHTSHFFNVLLYGLLLILLYKVLIQVFTKEKETFIFLTVIIFAMIPAHTEVVASLKNRDILLCYIFSMIGFLQFDRFLFSKKIVYIFTGIVAMITAFFAKFDALPLLLIFPILLFQKNSYTIKNIAITICIALLIYYGRGVIGDLLISKSTGRADYFNYENPLYFHNPLNLKLAVLLNSAGFYVNLLLLPFKLSSYYGYNAIPINQYISYFSVIGLIGSLLLIYGLIKFYKTPKHPIFIGCLFIMGSISMYLNFIIPVPGIVADRFSFFASTGFAIILCHFILLLINKKSKSSKDISYKTISVFFMLFIFQFTIIFNRNKEWKDLITLVSYDVKKHPNSVKLNVLYSNELISTITKKNNQLPVTEISKNIILAKEHLKKAFLIDSSYYNISNSLGFIEMSILNNPNEALFWLKKSHKYNPNKFETNLNLGLCYEKLNLQDSTIAYFNKALIIKPNDKNLNIYYPNYLKSINRTDLLHNTVTK